ncbi:MAG: serine hydrolase, partial [Caldilineaceae bacterium]|nr:serine hydrolase [Caldilineaceae bacterium]
SFATDVLGRVVEVASGQSLDDFFRQHILKPLGMDETGFHVPEADHHRFATNYSIFEEMRFGADLSGLPPHPPLHVLDAAQTSSYLRPPAMLSGGGGLVSTTADYLRFCQMLLNGGILDGARLLGPKTVALMRANHLPPALMPIGMKPNLRHGYGFGLGVRVLVDVAASAMTGSAGNYGWSGAAGTYFWIDPVEEMIGIFMMQFMPSDFYPIQAQFQNAVYQALVD